MDCFKNYIGIKFGTGAVAPSGFYIVQLPGIHLEVMDKIADGDQIGLNGVWSDVQTRASRRLKKDFLRLFSKRFIGYCCTREDCEPADVLCAAKEIFTDAWWYLLGCELVLERIYSPRLNRYTTIDKDQAVELKDFYGVEYEKAMEEAVHAIPHALVEDCFECVQSIQTVERLP